QAAQKERTLLTQQEQAGRSQLDQLQANLVTARAQLEALRGQTEAFVEAAKRAECEVKSNLTTLRTTASGSDWGQKLVGLDAGEALERAIGCLQDEAKQAYTDAQKRSGQIEQQVSDIQGKITKKKEFEAELNGLRPRHSVAAD